MNTELLQREAGEPLIVLVPHPGAWELAGLYLASKGPIASKYKPQRHLDEVSLATRQRNGAVLVPDGVGGIKHMLRALKRGEIADILPDQVARVDSGSVLAPSLVCRQLRCYWWWGLLAAAGPGWFICLQNVFPAGVVSICIVCQHPMVWLIRMTRSQQLQ